MFAGLIFAMVITSMNAAEPPSEYWACTENGESRMCGPGGAVLPRAFDAYASNPQGYRWEVRMAHQRIVIAEAQRQNAVVAAQAKAAKMDQAVRQ